MVKHHKTSAVIPKLWIRSESRDVDAIVVTWAAGNPSDCALVAKAQAAWKIMDSKLSIGNFLRKILKT
jgi:hypothetical protein